MSKGSIYAIRIFYGKLYTVIYGLLLLVLVQSIPLQLSIYTFIYTHYSLTYLISSSIESFYILVTKYILNVLLIIPLLSIEIIRAMYCHKMYILLLELFIFFLITGNIIFTFLYIILLILLVKLLKIFFHNSNKYIVYHNRKDAGVNNHTTVTLDKVVKIAMLLTSIGVAILIYIALAIFFKINVFLISIIIYAIMISISYVIESTDYSMQSDISILIKKAIMIGIPPFGVISYFKCQPLINKGCSSNGEDQEL